MDNITYFDACCYVGRHVHMREGQPETVEETLAAMDHFGIHEALVVDTLAREANPMAGNQRILERAGDHPRLHPAWAGLMSHSREMPPPRDLVAQMRQEGVGALFLFYGQFDIRLDEWGIDDLLVVLEESAVPLFLCPNNWRQGPAVDATDWTNVVRICQRFPALPVVITEHRIYKSQRALYAALEACPNLMVDVSCLWLHRRIEFICQHFGVERLVWGSQLPERDPSAVLMQVNYSDVSHEELAMIASGNMWRLLSWNENIQFVGDTVKLPEPIDSLHRAARERLSLRREEFYDCHGHIGWCSPHHVVEDTLDDLVREMDKFGIRKCCVFGLEGVFGDETYTNDEAARAVRRYPDRFVGFTLLNLNHGERLLRAEMERGLTLGLQGIKLINQYHGHPTESPLIDIVCEFAHKHRLLILNHHWGSASQIGRLCGTYPNACFITGHSTDAYADVIVNVDNLYVCTCPVNRWGDVEKFVKLYGPDRLMFGSDLTDLPIGWGMGPVFYAKIHEEDKRNILGRNMEELFRRHRGKE